MNKWHFAYRKLPLSFLHSNMIDILFINNSFVKMGLVNTLGSWYFKSRYKNIAKALDQYAQIQQETLKDLLEQAQETDFGKEFNFKDIQNYSQFKAQIPIMGYEEYYPYIQRMLEGKQEVCWPSPIAWFAKSSGTTNDRSKFIPVSYETMENCHFEAGKDILCLQYHQNEDSMLFGGKGLLIGGSNQTNPLDNGSSYGDLSAVLMNEMPFWANMAKTPDLSIALLEDWDVKVEKMARATLNENVTSISGVPTWTLVVLKKVLELSDKETIAEVWPNLELFIHGGISMVPYKEQFLKLIGHRNIQFIETYNASEGFFALQIDKEPVLTLMPQYGIFYEFIHLKTGEVCDINGIETHTDYELIISTNSGLWRYRIGDTIRFTNLTPPQFVISGRTKHFINAFGEELMVHNADHAFESICQKHQTELLDYTAAPIYFDDDQVAVGTHEWLISITQLPADPDAFKIDFDQELQNLNSDYAAKRKGNLAMSFPNIHLTCDDLFGKWLAHKKKLGGQHKVPRLSNDRSILEEVKGFG